MRMIAGTRWGAVLLGVLTGVAVQAQTTAGRTAGEASVTSTGAARYVIPLALPPGTNGLAPGLAITYDSRSGHGLLGVGFRLEGFSLIHRCAGTVAQDGSPAAVALGPGDHYCLDGQRLRLSGGSHGQPGAEYRTEVESFARIRALGTAGNGPASFRVERRDGRVYEYGTSEDARIESLGSTTPRAWAVSRVLDRSGNFIQFHYAEDVANGVHRPASIEYSGNAQVGTPPYYSVRFSYQARPALDWPAAYVAGGLVRESQRLARVEVVHVATQDVVRRYELSYDDTSGTGRGRLASLRECARSLCLPASRFEWSTGAPGWTGPAIVALGASRLASAIPGDMDGDGFEDLAYYDPDSRNWWVLRGGISGLAATAINTYSGADDEAAGAVSADLDGDGRRELLFRQGGYWRWLRRAGSGYASSSTGIAVGASGALAAADIDGDGRDDVVQRSASGDSLRWRRSRATSTALSLDAEQALWSAPPGSLLADVPFVPSAQRWASAIRSTDFNGDGRADLLVRVVPSSCSVSVACGSAGRWELLASSGSALLSQASIEAATAPLLADINADGLTDVAYVSADLSWQLLVGAGSRGNAAAVLVGPLTSNAGLPGAGAVAVATDWNGDGRTDLVQIDAAGHAFACVSDGTTLAACQALAGVVAGPVAAPIVLDANGDGLPDVAYASGSEARLLPRHATAPDLMVVATDGLGAESRFSYAPLTRSDVHGAGAGAVFPVRDRVLPGLVVASAVRAVDGGLLQETYTYEGARWHAQGRGFLGFARRSVLEAASGLRQVDEYLQDPSAYDRIGALSRSTLQLSSASPVTVSSYRWSRLAFGSGHLARSYPYVSSVTTDRYELDGVPFLRAVQTNTVDSFGTVVRRQVSVQELAKGASPRAQHIEVVTLGGVVNDTQNWCLGRPATTQVSRQHTLATGAQLVRRYAHGWDLARCRSTQDVVEPSSSTLKVTTDFAYDGHGNLATVSVSPAGQSVRRTSYAWTTDGRFPQSRTDAEGHVERATWNPVLALPVAVQDANGLTTQFAYDEFGRDAGSTAPDGTGTTTAHELCGDNCASPDARHTERITRRSRSGLALGFIETGYDRHGRAVYVRSDQPGGAEVWRTWRYDTHNRLAQASIPAACCGLPEHWVSFGYDALGRRDREYRPATGGSMARRAWRQDGLTLTETDALGRSTVHKFNALGAVAQVIDAAGADAGYEYDAFGNLVKVRDVNGAETLLSYDILGRRTGLLDRASGLWLYEYFPLGEVKRQVNGRGQVTTYTWDRLGRPLTRTEPEGLTTWTWGSSAAEHNVGALQSVQGPNVGERYAYDDYARLSSVVRNLQAMELAQAYTHDPESGLRETATYPSVDGAAPLRVRHRYDRGRLVELADADSGTSYWRLDAVDAFGHAAQETLGNGVQIVSSHDAASGLLSTRTAGPNGGASQQHLAFEWDAAGNLVRRHERNVGVEETFSYDAVNRLDEVRRDGRLTLDLAYDAVGNLTYKSDVGEYRYDADRGTLIAAGANTYSYDANGAVANASGTTIMWQSFDLPMRIRHPAGNYSMFEYGPDRARARQLALAGGGVTDTVYGPGGLYEHVTTDGEVTHRNYLVAEGRRVAVQTRSAGALPKTVYLLEDQLGSVDGFSSANGELLSRNSYQPFGAHRSGDWQESAPTPTEWQQIQETTPRGYTGHEHLNNLGVIHMNGRIYDPVLGRFLSPDPVVQAPRDTQAFNRYAYVRNNPLRYVDPSGFCAEGASSGAEGDGTSCLEEIFVDAMRRLSDSALYSGVDFWLQAAILTALPGLVALDSSAWFATGSDAQMEEVVVSDSRLRTTTGSFVAAPLVRPLPWEIGLGSSLSMLATSAGIAGLLALPASTSSTSDLLDENGEPRFVYHFTNDTGKRGISASRLLMPGASGRVYFSGLPYPTGVQAQSALALPRTPSGFFAIPRQNVPGPLTWSPVAPNFGQPGGGLEASFPGVVPTDGAQWYPIEP